MKQTVNLRPQEQAQRVTFGDAYSEATYRDRLNKGLEDPVLPTLPQAQSALEDAGNELSVAERKYAGVVAAIDSPDPGPGDLRSYTPWEVFGGGMGRRLRPWALEAREKLMAVREAHKEAERVFGEVSSKTAAALAAQTVRYAVAPGRRLPTSAVSALLQGEEVPADAFEQKDLARLVREGHILEKGMK